MIEAHYVFGDLLKLPLKYKNGEKHEKKAF